MSTNGQLNGSRNGNGSSKASSSQPWLSGYPYPTYEKGYWDGYRAAGQDRSRSKHDWSDWPYWAFAVTFWALLFGCLYMGSYYRDQQDQIRQRGLLLSERGPQRLEQPEDDPDDHDYTSPYLQ